LTDADEAGASPQATAAPEITPAQRRMGHAPPLGRVLRTRAGLIVGVGLPVVVFGVSGWLGAPWLAGDNLIQNYPLRVLVGLDLRHGHLPLWNPFVWSGTPLLAGFSAGAAYPATWLFAILPAGLAWGIGQGVAVALAFGGTYLLARSLGRSHLAAELAATSFAFGGFMAAQAIHLDLVEAGGLLPWACFALVRLAAGRRAAPQVVLLASALGLTVLSGAVEPVLDGGFALALLWAWFVARGPDVRARIRVGLGGIAGAALGAALGAVQLLPGHALGAQSQRGHASFWFFTSGSMAKSLLLLGVDPGILGGPHGLSTAFFGSFNLPEVSSYVGLLPVVALFAQWSRRHRRLPDATEQWPWYAMAAGGVLLALGNFTPLGHGLYALLYHVPIVDHERLLNRNLLEVDLAVCVLFARWLDAGPLAEALPPFATRARRADRSVADAQSPGSARAHHSGLDLDEAMLSLAPLALVVALQLAAIAVGPWWYQDVLGTGRVSRATLLPLDAFLTIETALACMAAWIVLEGRRGSVRGPRRLLRSLVRGLLRLLRSLVRGPHQSARANASLGSPGRTTPASAQRPEHALLEARDPARWRRRVVAAFVVVDLLLFNGFFAPEAANPISAANPSAPLANELAQRLARLADAPRAPRAADFAKRRSAPPAVGELAGSSPPASQAGRVAFFDPDLYYADQLDELGQPDLTLLRGIDTVNGYGALVAAAYDQATGAHRQLNLRPSMLASPLVGKLDVRLLVAAPEYFAHLVAVPAQAQRWMLLPGATVLPPGPPRRSSGRGGLDRALRLLAAAQPTPTVAFDDAPPPPPPVLEPGKPLVRNLGTVLDVRALALPLRHPSADLPRLAAGQDRVLVRLIGPSGRPSGPWLPARPRRLAPARRDQHPSASARGSWVLVAAPPRGVEAAAIEILMEPTACRSFATTAAVAPASRSDSMSGPAGTACRLGASLDLGYPLVATSGQGAYRLDGALSAVVVPPRFRFAGRLGPFALFATAATQGPAWLLGPGRLELGPTNIDGSATAAVTTPASTTLVRSETAAPGWRAVAVSASGARLVLPVGRDGILQAVRLPPGRWRVRFSYEPRSVSIGGVISLGAILVLLALGLGPPAVRWPRRRRPAGPA
jgi:hypothetical protein